MTFRAYLTPGHQKGKLYVRYQIHMLPLTSPAIRTQSSASVETDGFPNSQLVKVTGEWSLQSNSPSVLMSFSPIHSSSVDAAAMDSKEYESCHTGNITWLLVPSKQWYHGQLYVNKSVVKYCANNTTAIMEKYFLSSGLANVFIH